MSVIAFFFAFIAAAAAQADATGTIRGRVQNQASRAPLQGATVTLAGTDRFYALTANDGSFRLTHVPAGDQVVVVNYTGVSSSLTKVSPAPACHVNSGLAAGQVGSYVLGYFSELKNQWVLKAGINGYQMTITSGNAADGCVIIKS